MGRAFVLTLCFIFSALPCFAQTLEGSADFTPWSGYWWPVSLGELYNGYAYDTTLHPSPIEKYDFAVSGGYPGALSIYAKDPENFIFDPAAPGWHGYCGALANAVLLEHIDFKPSFFKGALFNVGDKKGLVTLAHYDDPQLSQGCASNPAHFHRYVLQYLYEQSIGFAADLVPGEQFWSYPIYWFSMDITESSVTASVTCRIRYANDIGIHPDFQGLDQLEARYDYVLNKDETGAYTGGRWIGNQHPAFLWIPLEQHTDIYCLDYELVREIAESSGDGYENVTKLSPGHAPLLLAPNTARSFTLDIPANGTPKVSLALDPQSQSGSVSYEIYRNNERVANGTAVREPAAFDLPTTRSEDEYSLALAHTGDTSNTVAVHVYVDLDMAQSSLSCQPAVNFNQGGWIGAGCANEDGSVGNAVRAVVLGENGLPLKGLSVPSSLTGYQKWAAVADKDVYTDLAYAGAPAAVRFVSENPLATINLSGVTGKLSSKSITGATDKNSTRGVVPFFTDTMNYRQQSKCAVHNKNTTAQDITFTYCSPYGGRVSSRSISLHPGETKTFSGSHPGGASGEFWALVQATSGLHILNHVEFKPDRWDELPVLPIGSSWIIPHVASGNGWTTRITLCNPSGREQNVGVAAVLGDGTTRQAQWTLPAWSRQEKTMIELFPTVSGSSLSLGWAAVNSPAETAGFFSYEAAGVRSSLPLVAASQEPRSTARLAHVAEDGYWWTGLAVLNLDSSSNAVRIQGFDAQGNLVAVAERVLNPSAKSAWTMASLFPENFFHVASLRLDADAGICPFALYGGSDASGSVLSGMLF